MNKREIIAELRRSALHDAHPFRDCAPSAYYEAVNMRTLADAATQEPGRLDQHRVFFLLVAEALDRP